MTSSWIEVAAVAILVLAMLAVSARRNLRTAEPAFARASPEASEHVRRVYVDDSTVAFRDAMVENLDAFFEAYRKTFRRPCGDVADMKALEALAIAVAKNGHEIVQRMPNDAYARRDTSVAMRNLQALLDGHAREFRERCKLPFEASGMPLEDRYVTSEGLRAFNDEDWHLHFTPS